MFFQERHCKNYTGGWW